MVDARESLGRWVKRFPIEDIVLDLGIVLLALGQSRLDRWVAAHTLTTFVAAGPLQVLAIACATWGFRSWVAEMPEHGLWRVIAGFYGLILVLAVGGFAWLALPALALDTTAAWRVFTLQAFVVVFGSVLVFGLIGERESVWPPPFKLRAVFALGIFVYLAVAGSLLLLIANSGKVGIIVVVAATAMSYLPVRLLLVLRPPWSLVEVATALAAYVTVLANFF